LVTFTCLKELWSEFVMKYGQEMYEEKIAYTLVNVGEDNIRITFQDNRGYQMLHNFLRSKRSN